jgi:mono/diheme cytochrome c family protein
MRKSPKIARFDYSATNLPAESMKRLPTAIEQEAGRWVVDVLSERTMSATKPSQPRWAATGFLVLLSAAVVLGTIGTRESKASGFRFWRWRQDCSGQVASGVQLSGEPGGAWQWLRSPEEEKRVVIALYSRYCVRCHGVDGRGIWDIPGVPDFTNTGFQASRSDAQLTRVILEGRGACMPPFRGTLTLEEAWAMARYLRTFVPGSEVSRPDSDPTGESIPQLPLPRKSDVPVK